MDFSIDGFDWTDFAGSGDDEFDSAFSQINDSLLDFESGASDMFGDLWDADFLSDFGGVEYDWNAPGANDFNAWDEASNYYDAPDGGGIGGMLGGIGNTISSIWGGMSAGSQSLVSSAILGALQGAAQSKAQRNATASASAASQAQWERLMKSREVPGLDKLRAGGAGPANAGYFGVKFGGR